MQVFSPLHPDAGYPIKTRLMLDALSAGDEQIAVTNGRSMEPTIRHGDTLVLTALEHQPNQGDIVVYPDDAGNLVAHRYLAPHAPGMALIRGDRLHARRELVPTHALMGKVIAIQRKGRRRELGRFAQRMRSKAWLFYRSWRERAGYLKGVCLDYAKAS